MKWTIQQLHAQKSKGIQFNETLDLSDLRKLDPQIRRVSPVEVSGEAHVSSDIVTFPLHIKGTLTLPCSRTLNDVELPFDIEAKETFRLYETNWEQDGEDDIHSVEGDVIDLIPYIKELILLEIPLQIFSEQEEGRAPKSGDDWELVKEEDLKNRTDPRLAELSKFFDNK
ncbi:YceD family protein [Alkalihalobacillus sp. LMS39]|uniref:YceD family protein n=1 Tax=Alkalihalobacillus sp. LMS39 TaxID=2924032 RepID=UPI001FB3C404|nr:YceD family protein [Alkalihalobacillus sp. LMS39]UOE92944.1 YceD family protein [Alkalihalobacillus sp. LMS39]